MKILGLKQKQLFLFDSFFVIKKIIENINIFVFY